MLEYIILGFLMKNELSGYDLKQWMIHSTSYFYEASFGSIYPALKRMEDKGYIQSKETVQNGKYKNIYSITLLGKDTFLSWIKQPISFSKTDCDFLVRIFFYEYVPKDIIKNNLEQFIEEVKPYLNSLQEQKDRINKKGSSISFRYSTLIFGVEHYEHIISWCQELLKDLES